MWTIFHSIAGMNDDKVLACDQINNIMKEVRIKYKKLGKKVNLDALCGNKFYRKELTAIKYIQAKKILEKWRQLKSIREERAKNNGAGNCHTKDAFTKSLPIDNKPAGGLNDGSLKDKLAMQNKD